MGDRPERRAKDVGEGGWLGLAVWVVALVLCLFWSALVEEKSKKTKPDRATDKVGHISGTQRDGSL